MDDLYVGAYWGARQETSRACAEKLAGFLKRLSTCDAVFAKWFRRGMSRSKAMEGQIDISDAATLLPVVEKGRNRKDVGGAVMEELGFHIGMWNGGKPEKSVGLDVICGSYTTVSGLGNSVVIELPEELGDLRQPERMADLLLAVARSWEPDWGGVISRRSRNTRDLAPGMPLVDWMLYLSKKLAPNPIVPEPSSVRAVDPIGSLIVVQQEPVEAENPFHLRRVKAVETALGIQ
jgi:hypothetical protein